MNRRTRCPAEHCATTFGLTGFMPSTISMCDGPGSHTIRTPGMRSTLTVIATFSERRPLGVRCGLHPFYHGLKEKTDEFRIAFGLYSFCFRMHRINSALTPWRSAS